MAVQLNSLPRNGIYFFYEAAKPGDTVPIARGLCQSGHTAKVTFGRA